MMKTKIRFFLFIIFLSSCQSHQINPGSERIRVLETEPKGCLFVGEVSSVQEDVIEGVNAGEPDMALATRIDLRNKSHSLGGNVLVFTKNKDKKSAGDASKKAPAAGAATEEDKSEKKISTTFLATTFRCPASVVNQ